MGRIKTFDDMLTMYGREITEGKNLASEMEIFVWYYFLNSFARIAHKNSANEFNLTFIFYNYSKLFFISKSCFTLNT